MNWNFFSVLHNACKDGFFVPDKMMDLWFTIERKLFWFILPKGGEWTLLLLSFIDDESWQSGFSCSLLISESKVALFFRNFLPNLHQSIFFPLCSYTLTRITWLKWEDFEVSTFLLCCFSRDPFLNFQSALSHLFQRRSKTWHSKEEKLENALKIGFRTEKKKGNFILIVSVVFQDCRGRSDRNLA